MIELDKLEYSHKSMMDDFGRVFFYEDRVYRAISNTSKEECLELLNSELFQILISKSLIPRTQITDFKLPDYDLILEHEKLLEIQQHEWSFEMSKKAALTVIEINNICNQFGYELKDAHTFNILFRGLSPVFVDIGSIVKRSGSSWIAMKEFICTFYLPLAFWSQSEMFIVRKLVESNFYKLQTVPNQDIFESKLLNLLSKKPYSISLNINKYTLFKSNTHLNIFVFFSLLGNKF
jgi:sulfur relay (sulfurtransferase) DsrF/TusC family protein